MSRKQKFRGISAVLIIGAALLIVLADCLPTERRLSEILADLHLPQQLVRQELGGYFVDLKAVNLATSLALRQLPLFDVNVISQKDVGKTPDISSEPIEKISENISVRDLIYSDNGVPSQTVIPTNPAGYTVVNGVYIKNASNKTLEANQLTGDFAAKLAENAPQVLILHTHGSEAYSPSGGIAYHSTGNYRTDEEAYSVIRVGDEIAATLSSYGISVLHDRERYDDPLYDGAYERSDAAIQAYLEKYPGITFILDIHRDAVQDGSGQQYKLVCEEDETLAQLSFIMGSNHEGWEENLKLAIAVSAQVSAEHPTAMRPITLRNSNYNQDYTLGSMLVEVGTAGNSPEEAIHAGQVLAKAFAETLLENSMEN